MNLNRVQKRLIILEIDNTRLTRLFRLSGLTPKVIIYL